MHKQLLTLKDLVIGVETGNKVYNPTQRNNNFIHFLLNIIHAILITFNQLFTHIYSNVYLFTSSIVLMHLRAYVTVILHKTLHQN